MKISHNLFQAWRLLKGSQLILWLGALAWVGITALILILGWLLNLPLGSIPLTWLTLIITAPLFAGLNMVAIKHVRGEPISIKTGFSYFNQWISLAGAFLLICILSTLVIFLSNMILNISSLHYFVPSFLLASVSTVIFNAAYAFLIFTIPLITDLKMPIIKALAVSIQTTQKHWLKILSLLLIFYALNLISLFSCEIPFVGIICYIIISFWLIPFIFLSIGLAYHQLVDREPTCAAIFANKSMPL